MPRGGPRAGAGRPKGARNKKTLALMQAVEEGLTPLGYMLDIMRDKKRTDAERFEAAKSAAPYCHARLASTDSTVTLTGHEDALSELE